jgi:hypothetical protein
MDMDTLDLHVCGVTGDGKLWHTSRSIQNSHVSWSPWEEVKAAGMSSSHHFVKVACVSTRREKDGSSTDKELHVLATTDDGKLLHTSRLVQQNWQPFEDLSVTIGSGGPFRNVEGNEFRGELDICAIVSVEHGDQRILHTSRSSSGAWEKFEDITQPPLASFPGSFTAADCALGFAGVALLTELHICGVTADGGIWYTLHFWQPPWLPFANVQAVSTNATAPFTEISVALIAGDLHLCARANGELWHTVRFSDPPRWQAAFENVKEKSGNPGSFLSAKCASLGSELHIVGFTADGKLWHTSVSSTASPPVWKPFEDVTALIGNNPGSFTSISVSGDPGSWGPIGGGGDPTCDLIQKSIVNDALQIQTLQRQEASTNNQAAIAQMNRQIAALRQDIASLQQQARAHHCP